MEPRPVLKVLDLFSGIGGFSLGLERAGMQTIGFCENNPHCRAVLHKHWPWVPVFPDVRGLCRRTWDNGPVDPYTGDRECTVHPGQDFAECPCVGTDQFTDSYGWPDLICGGFPCQDISHIGKRGGISGEDSGLWYEFARIIGELQPKYVLVENVAALRNRGLGTVLGDLASLGYDACWHCIPASYLGAPHRRDRIWIMADRLGSGLERYARYGEAIRAAVENRPVGPKGIRGGEHPGRWWATEPAVGRVVNGLPGGLVKRHLTALGNAVVPQMAEVLGRAILHG